LIRLVLINIVLLSLITQITNAQQIVPNVKSGIYESSFTLYLNMVNEDLEIKYTTDGTEPNTTSNSYSKENGIFIEDRSNKEDHFSLIPTVANNWIDPQQPIPKATIIWAQAYYNNVPIGHPSISSYFVNLKYSFPVFSIVGKPEYLFSDSTGILIPGDSYDAINNKNGNSGMRGRAWERPVQLEFIENNKLVLQQNVGIRIHGLSSRALPQKSLRVYARNSKI